ncbi:MAG: hypothetical protein U0R71_10660 [Solirubrobacterales bacterium]
MLVSAAGASAATREPIALINGGHRGSPGAQPAARLPRPAIVRRLASRGAGSAGADQGPLAVSSSVYGPEQEAAVGAALAGLDHGPEIAQLSVYLASPEELAATCGAVVVACYSPDEDRMVVSGAGQASAGVPRAFAIAHEYGHHIANTQQADLEPPIDAGTIRWATYERVCQLTRRGILFPGDQGAHYWADPGEAFAESYAHLADPQARVAWQYAPQLRPTRASLAKLQADISAPWSGPISISWSGSVPAPPPAPPRRQSLGAGTGLSSAIAVSPAPGTAARLVRTPLDGTVAVSVRATAGGELDVILRDAAGGRVLRRAVAGAEGAGTLSYPNCGHDSLWLEVRSGGGDGGFEATISTP